MTEEKELTEFEAHVFRLGEGSDYGIRIHTDPNGQPWFVVRDLAEALELTGHSNTTTLVERIPDAFREYLTVGNIPNVSGMVRESYMVAEPACYYLILTSKAENAFPMCRWVCEDVLPSIRETGGYAVNDDNRNKVPEGFAELAVKFDDLVEYNKEFAKELKQDLKEGQKALHDILHTQSIPMAEAVVRRRKYNRKDDEAYTDDELRYFKYLNEELGKCMGGGKAQVSGHINTCWRRKFGYKLETSKETATTGKNYLLVASREHSLKLKFPNNELVRRLGHDPEKVRPPHTELLRIMEDELMAESGQQCSLEEFLRQNDDKSNGGA